MFTTTEYTPFATASRLTGHSNSQRNGYRFHFNGKELDKEGMGGGGSTYDYGFRIYNAQLGKFLSVDPLTKSYPWYTPFQFSGNMPISAIDLDGLEELVVIYWYKDGKYIGSTTMRVPEADRVEKANGTVMYLSMDIKNKNMVNTFKRQGDNSWKDVVFAKDKNGSYGLKANTSVIDKPINKLDEINMNELRSKEGKKNENGDLISQMIETEPRVATIKFKQGSFELFEVDGNQKFIEGAKMFLSENPHYVLKITGFASLDGEKEANKKLSLQRAEKFKEFLVKNGIDKDRIITEGAGVTGGDSEKSKEESRRVEMTPVVLEGK